MLGISVNRQTNAPIANAHHWETELPEIFRDFDWQTEAARGDTKQGQELFTTRGCAVCHEIKSGDKGGGGPSLAGAGSRFNVAYLVESVITPNKTVAPMFRWTLVRFKDDEEVAGLVTGETSDEIDLLLPAGVHRAVRKGDIAKREIQDRSPMPEGMIQNQRNSRFTAFLSPRSSARPNEVKSVTAKGRSSQ